MAPSVESVQRPDRRIVEVAERFSEENKIDLKRQAGYIEVDDKRGKRLSDAEAAMAHAPQDPVVKYDYENLASESTYCSSPLFSLVRRLKYPTIFT
jgi:hypothetical protein